MPHQTGSLESVLVKSYDYDEESHVLILKLRDATYSFARVPRRVVSELVAAKSVGYYFVKSIRSKYACATI
jgi:hypothetical protein